MKNHFFRPMLKNNLQIATERNRLKILTRSFGLAGISFLIGLPILAQGFYPPLYLFQPQAGSNYPYRAENNNLLNTLKKESNFANLVVELEEAGLTEALTKEKYTVLAPTDAAFDALPDEVFDKLSEPENLNRVLEYHLVSGEVSEEDIAQGKISTVEGGIVNINKSSNYVSLNDAKVTVPPIKATNGVIIKIDKVLFPPGF